MNSPAVSLRKLTKSYGKNRGIVDISFDIYPGEVFGFLGPNGAGKSTAIRTLLGLISATSGTAEILGQDALKNSAELRAQVGYLPGALSLNSNYTAWELLHQFAKLRNIDCTASIQDLASRLKLDLHKKIGELSKGNRQKVGVIQAFMHLPKVLFLDEPTSGLDPLAQREFEKILDEVKARGGAVMLSSHVLSEVEHLADTVAVINDGKLLVVDRVANLKAKALRHLDLSFDSPVAVSVFDGIAAVKAIGSHGTTISCEVVGSEHEILKRAVEHGVVAVQSHEPSLEEIFLRLVESPTAQ
ncbi:MAG: ABC transporter ATP-binding protein [Actinobacteria bacterium]|nr:ABC transporter ATP-binding protein [Actinomycetota bacterium]